MNVPASGRFPRAAVPGTLMEQVVDVPVHGQDSSVPEECVEQVVDVPRSRHAPRTRGQASTGSLAASLDYAEEPVQGFFFALLPRTKKCGG